MKKGPMVTPRRTTLLVTTFATCVTVALSLAVTTEAQTTSPTQPAASETLTGSISNAISNALSGPEASTTTVPLSNSFVPATPWPPVTTISQTALQAPHDLLAYTGVEAAASKQLGHDFGTWRNHFTNAAETEILPHGMLMSSGCLKPCDMHKSLLIVSPETQKVYAAMVTEGKVAMWPSLMSWPDDAIPSLKSWLAAATDNTPEK